MVTGAAPAGQLRRLTIMFCDLVGSTAMSARHEPERYRQILGRYKRTCQEIVEGTYDGHIAKVKGDGLLVFFGHPSPHEDDVRRAVRAGLDLVAAMHRLSEQTEQDVGETLAARVAVHRGPVYLDPDEDDVYGLAANLAARLQELAPPGSLVVSDEVRRLLGDRFETEPQEPQKVKGLDDPLPSWRVVAERPHASARWRRWSTPLVGRNEPLAVLRDAWRSRPGAAVVRGEPGIGKSRLAAALAIEVAEPTGVTEHPRPPHDAGLGPVADRAGAPGADRKARREAARVVELAGSPLHPDVGFHPLRVLIERGCHMDRASGDPERLDRLHGHLVGRGLDADDLVPLLAPVLGIDPAAGYQPTPAEGRKLVDDIAVALTAYLRAALGDGPALLLVDDGHWLDGATRQIVAHLVREPPPGSLVVMTTRDRAGWLPAGATVVDLTPLPAAEGAALVAALDPSGRLAVAPDDLVARGGGIPLYIEELTRAALAAPPTEAPDALDALDAQDQAPAPTAVPETLYEPLVARLHATPAGCRVTGAAATVGRDVDAALLAELVDIDRQELAGTLADLVAATILVVEPVEPEGAEAAGGPSAVAEPGARYRFRHELLREVAYELQPPSVRRRLHGRVADGLTAAVEAGRGRADWRVLAHHNERAARPGAALACYERSAEEARRRGALAEARADLDRAIDLLWAVPEAGSGGDALGPRGGPGPGGRGVPDGGHDTVGDGERSRREMELRLRRAFLAVSSEGNASPTAAADHERCLELATVHRSGGTHLATLTATWGYHTSRGDLATARHVLEVLQDDLEDGWQWLRPENEAGSGMLDWFRGRFPAARDQLERAAAAVEARGDDAPTRATWFMPNDPRVAISTHGALARYVTGDPAGALAAFARGEQQAAELPFPQGPFSAAYNHLYAAWARRQMGDLDGAEHHVEQVERSAREHGFDFMTLAGATQRAELDAARALRADPIDAAAASTSAAALAHLVVAWQVIDVRAFLTTVLTSLGAALAAAGDPVAAGQRLEESLRLAGETGCEFHMAETLRVRALLAGDPVAGGRSRPSVPTDPTGQTEPVEQGLTDPVEQGLRRALDLAKEQGAVAVRLRIARDLCRRRAPGGRAELAAALDLFAPGASYPELDAARALLA